MCSMGFATSACPKPWSPTPALLPTAAPVHRVDPTYVGLPQVHPLGLPLPRWPAQHLGHGHWHHRGHLALGCPRAPAQARAQGFQRPSGAAAMIKTLQPCTYLAALICFVVTCQKPCGDFLPTTFAATRKGTHKNNAFACELRAKQHQRTCGLHPDVGPRRHSLCRGPA